MQQEGRINSTSELMTKDCALAKQIYRLLTKHSSANVVLVLRWEGPKEPDSKVLYYTIQKKKDTQGEEWKKLAEYIDVDEASYMSK